MPNVSIEDRTAITDAIHTFFHLVDIGRASETADLFANDALLTFGPGSPQPGTIEGAAIQTAMVAREALKSAFTRHAVSNLKFDTAESGISAGYLLTLYRSDDNTRSSFPAFVADVAEVWQHAGSKWQMRERTITPAFVRP